ncbi:MAG TPA: tRNA (adenosine(37)-N6)-threonylcarbamoyltransferase complex ATPase subunit type 1 TsaE [Ktedonobacterales bacterium]|nr:tRNA (adenosine(37)-N6)-threonylcarbamoyltransferase complex ATPase subunit type 1 TsaE [Ktedonobacterales bacterium]
MPALRPSISATPAGSTTFMSRSERETRRIGATLGQLCQPGDLILLEGNLGAGKTALTQGIGHGLGITGVINSPTFTLIKEYRGRIPLYHFDLYRLEHAAQVADLGIEEYLDGDGVCVVEWAERAAALWPVDWLRLRLRISGPLRRRILVDSAGARGQALSCQLVNALRPSQRVPARQEEMA